MQGTKKRQPRRYQKNLPSAGFTDEMKECVNCDQVTYQVTQFFQDCVKHGHQGPHVCDSKKMLEQPLPSRTEVEACKNGAKTGDCSACGFTQMFAVKKAFMKVQERICG